MEGSGDNFVRIRALSVPYSSGKGDGVRALDDLSLNIRAGEVLGILGESGCGKSTLANALLKLLPAHAKIESGQILLQGPIC